MKPHDLRVERGVAVPPYFSLASGFLTGKYRSADDLGSSAQAGMVRKYLNDMGLRILAVLDDMAAGHSASPAQVTSPG
ncbi:MAG: hypothetical protein ABW048_04445 [Sphingobium sp.]